MKAGYKIIDYLIANPTKTNLMALDKVLALGIPFNAPHGFKIKTLNADSVLVKLPNRKLNQNHLGGVHACAMATVGEFSAGMAILMSFGISTYRIILAELNVKYTYQGRTDVEAICNPHQIDKEAIKAILNSEGKHVLNLETIIRDINGKEVAIVATTWQLKNWNLVKTKD